MGGGGEGGRSGVLLERPPEFCWRESLHPAPAPPPPPPPKKLVPASLERFWALPVAIEGQPEL